MKELIINQIIVPVIGAVIGTILEVARRQVKSYLDAKKELIDKQKQAIQQSMGIEQYNKDKQIIKDAVMTVEQLGKEFDWEGTLKHYKVLELIEGKTSLKEDEIYNIIKAVVAEINISKNKPA